MNNIKVGIVGVGYLGTQHARILSYLEEAELQAVADIDFQKALQIGNRHGVKYFENYEDMIDEIDAAVVATDTSAHFTVSDEPPPARQARPGREADHRDGRAGRAAPGARGQEPTSSSRSAISSGSTRPSRPSRT